MKKDRSVTPLTCARKLFSLAKDIRHIEFGQEQAFQSTEIDTKPKCILYV